jgi:uncharacterized protein YjiS (DUF1127 family)
MTRRAAERHTLFWRFEMAHSLFGERSVAPASSSTFFASVTAWATGFRTARARQANLRRLLEFDQGRLADLGISHADIVEAMAARNGRTSGMVLNAARARNSRA